MVVRTAAALALALGSAAATQAADLTGQTVTIAWLFPDQATVLASQTVTVGAGAEVACPGAGPLCSAWGGTAVQYDLGATTISFTALSSTAHASTAFNGYRISGLAAGGAWSGASVLGMDAARLSFDGDVALLQVGGLQLPAGSGWTISLTSAVPEGGSLGLMAAGLLLLAARRRRAARA